ncbi:PHP domain-containing protein [Aestuariivivens insulae]|uniref:PHP domain-containing protein n=1 Tax=Aestuariivivens insulae TaxID=1621988 RepID=UPI001F57F018|nr:histidinol-phosphatase [Aestuariivivens insulae]
MYQPPSSFLSCAKFVLLFFLFTVISCKKPIPSNKKQWFKGNLHTHSYWSDGDEFPEVIMQWYKSHDYDFVALTDHNILAEGDKWVKIRPDSIYQNGFKSYLDTFGSNWVNYKKDSLNNIYVKLKTFEEYRTKFEAPNTFLILQAEEISDRFENKPIHINATNLKKKIQPQGGNSVVDVMQNNLDEIAKQKDSLNIPILAHINHPNFHYSITVEDMIALKKEQFFEVYNGHPDVRNSGDSNHISTEKMWDLINIAYIENNKPLMYGLATDDSHHYHKKGHQWSNAGRGWVMVQADTLSPKSIINAMESGNFYASTGVFLDDVSTDNSTLSVTIKKEANLTYKITFIGCKKGNNTPEALKTVTGDKASFKITKDILFVRCKVTSSKHHDNPIENLIYETAWTQPTIYKRD